MAQDADLDDRLAVGDVIIAYANGIDDRDFDAYRRLFHPDVVLRGFAAEPIQGLEAWMGFVEKALAPYRQTQHMLGPPSVCIEGDTATLRADLQALHFPREKGGQVFSLWGAYRTRLAREDASWRIREHQLDVWGTRLG